ncbi:hypothetical protein RRG08_057783 [Elysia crispata]|uniref:Uncharacterized protein n=1 Tax=Elysia crispata TaxID=231223 RepID=A0AAE0Z3P7_9GAST|nr:hypothetical protein RRG08_057783 [Elysia crispata]
MIFSDQRSHDPSDGPSLAHFFVAFSHRLHGYLRAQLTDPCRVMKPGTARYRPYRGLWALKQCNIDTDRDLGRVGQKARCDVLVQGR